MEIYTNTQPKLTLNISSDSNPMVEADVLPTVEFIDAEDNSTVGDVIDLENGKYTTEFPLKLTNDEAKYVAKWHFVYNGDDLEREEHIQVIQPYLTINELREVNDKTASMNDKELAFLEKSIRATINGFTQQNFGRHETTITLPGNGTNNLSLPYRIYRLDTVNYGWYGESPDYNLVDYGVVISNDNYSIYYGQQYLNRPSWTWTSPGVIMAPPWNVSDELGFFDEMSRYIIHGMFGWEWVPNDVKLAAEMLAQDFTCNEDTYRKKRIKSVNSGNWRMDFDPDSFSGTGNADVDIILGNYVNAGMAVI